LETMGQYGAAAHVLPASSDKFVSGREAAGALVASGFAPTAILCVNDLTAVGVLKELSERGISVPRQISVTGFDNIALSQVTIPSLTTIQIPGEQIARLAFQALVSSSNGPSIMGQEITVDPELIVRQSTGPAPANADRPNDV
jgi:LacI family transcriptional regulator